MLIPSLIGVFAWKQVFAAMVQEKSAALAKDPAFKASSFSWAAVLKWKPPKGTCPKGQQKGVLPKSLLSF